MFETLVHAILEQVEQPKKDLEKNLTALLQETVSKLDLVSKQEFDRQRQSLDQANERMAQLQAQVEQLQALMEKSA